MPVLCETFMCQLKQSFELFYTGFDINSCISLTLPTCKYMSPACWSINFTIFPKTFLMYLFDLLLANRGALKTSSNKLKTWPAVVFKFACLD